MRIVHILEAPFAMSARIVDKVVRHAIASKSIYYLLTPKLMSVARIYTASVWDHG